MCSLYPHPAIIKKNPKRTLDLAIFNLLARRNSQLLLVKPNVISEVFKKLNWIIWMEMVVLNTFPNAFAVYHATV